MSPFRRETRRLWPSNRWNVNRQKDFKSADRQRRQTSFSNSNNWLRLNRRFQRFFKVRSLQEISFRINKRSEIEDYLRSAYDPKDAFRRLGSQRSIQLQEKTIEMRKESSLIKSQGEVARIWKREQRRRGGSTCTRIKIRVKSADHWEDEREARCQEYRQIAGFEIKNELSQSVKLKGCFRWVNSVEWC